MDQHFAAKEQAAQGSRNKLASETAATFKTEQNGSKQNGSNTKTAVKSAVTPDFALGGRCPVTLIRDGKWASGDAKFGCVHRGRVYIFADANALKVFQVAPDSFSPILAGYDPVEFHESGTLVDGKEEHGVFIGKSPEHKIVLFSSLETRKKFQAEPQKYMSTVRTALQNSGRTIR